MAHWFSSNTLLASVANGRSVRLTAKPAHRAHCAVQQAEVHEAERRGKAEVAAARQRAAEARERHSEDLKMAQASLGKAK